MVQLMGAPPHGCNWRQVFADPDAAHSLCQVFAEPVAASSFCQVAAGAAKLVTISNSTADNNFRIVRIAFFSVRMEPEYSFAAHEQKPLRSPEEAFCLAAANGLGVKP